MADENKEIKSSSDPHPHELSVTVEGVIGNIATQKES